MARHAACALQGTPACGALRLLGAAADSFLLLPSSCPAFAGGVASGTCCVLGAGSGWKLSVSMAARSAARFSAQGALAAACCRLWGLIVNSAESAAACWARCCAGVGPRVAAGTAARDTFGLAGDTQGTTGSGLQCTVQLQESVRVFRTAHEIAKLSTVPRKG